MNPWAPIQYTGLFDVPLVFVVQFQQERYLLECEFLHDLEEYADVYKVYCLPTGLDPSKEPSDWTLLRKKASRFLGKIPVQEVQFDPTRRREVNTAVLEKLLALVPGE